MGLLNRRGLGAEAAGLDPNRSRGGGGGVQANRGNQGNHGGGGGGGGHKLPNTGLYYGDAGEAYANRNPLAYFRAAVSKVGGLNYSGTPISQFSEDFVNKLMDDYATALGGHQRWSPIDYLRREYGAGFLGKKKGNYGFRQGTLGTGGGALDSAYTDWYSNTDQPGYLTGQLAKQGGMVAGGGNDAFHQFYQQNFIPGLQAELLRAQASDPNLSMADLVGGRDLVTQARQQYLNRPGSQRQLGPVNLGARWSWYD